MPLAGAFAAGGVGLKESKQEKRERLELAELQAFVSAPAWASEDLLLELRKHGKASNAERVPLTLAPIFGTASTPRAGGGNDVRDAILHARAIAQLEHPAGLRAALDEPDGVWFVVQPPKAAGWATEELVLCLGMTKSKTLCGAVGCWPKAKVSPKAKEPVRAEEATRIVLIDDAAGEFPAMAMGHPSISGVGQDHTRPLPVSRDILAPVPLHVCEAVQLYLVAKAQLNARLQRGGAGEDERSHCTLLVKEGFGQLQRFIKGAKSLATINAQLMADINKVEIAVAGLRKAYLPREWEPRCSVCGIRHTALETGTCKFWVKYAQQAQDKGLRLASGGEAAPPTLRSKPSPETLISAVAGTSISPVKAAPTLVVVTTSSSSAGASPQLQRPRPAEADQPLPSLEQPLLKRGEAAEEGTVV